MGKITSIDRQVCKLIASEIDAALQAVAARHGLSIAIKGGSFDYTMFQTKLVVCVTGKDGAPTASPEAKEFALYAPGVGVPAKLLNTKVVIQGTTYTLIGYKSRSPKYPFICLRADGRRFKMTTHSVVSAIKSGEVPATSDTLLVKGARVTAKWKDGDWYSGVYELCVATGAHRVLFDDGVRYVTREVKLSV